MPAQSATKPRSAPKNDSATRTARATKARSAAKKPSVVKSDPLSELLQAYRDVPNRVSEHGHAPLREFDGRFVESGERMVFLRSTANAGKKQARQAVYVHGLGGSARNWTDLMYLLDPVVGGIAPDLPGFGRSPMPADGDYSQSAHAQVVIDLIEDRCDGPVDLFGNSMGGSISVRIAALRPDLVRSLVLISPALPNLRPRLGVVPLVAMTAPVLADLTSRLVDLNDPEAAIEHLEKLCYLDPTRVHEERRADQLEETRWRMSRPNSADPLRHSARGLGKAFLPGMPDNLWTLAEQVKAPTLVIFGTHDKLVDPRLANRAARTFGNARVTTLHTGHVAQIEDPVTTARLVLQLWAEDQI